MSNGIQVFDGDCIDWQQIQKDTADKKEQIALLKKEIAVQDKKLKNAQRNRNRQRAREEEGKTVRITSDFWTSVAHEYLNSTRALGEQVEILEGSMTGPFRERPGFRWFSSGLKV